MSDKATAAAKPKRIKLSGAAQNAKAGRKLAATLYTASPIEAEQLGEAAKIEGRTVANFVRYHVWAAVRKILRSNG